MAKKNRIKELEAEKGNLERVIPPLVNRVGQAEAARLLKTSQATISRWLDDNNYTLTSFWQKATTPQEAADIDAAVERVNAARRAQGLPTLEAEAADELA